MGVDTPLLDYARQLFQTKHRFSKDIVDRGLAAFGDGWALECESMLRSVFGTEDRVASAVKGYSAFAIASMRQQAQFERDRRYATQKYSDALAEVYLNDEYMTSEYLPGLLLSHYLWPHHYRQLQFFHEAFVNPTRIVASPEFLEVGVGTGLYSRLLLQGVDEIRGLGIDISPASQAFAREHMRAFGLDQRYRIDLCDVFAAPIEPTARLICVEVLEHLEDPLSFLKRLRSLLGEGGKAFITAAVSAAHADHIYLYNSAEEVLAQIVSAGFVLEQYYVGAAYPPPRPGTPVPIAAAFVVT